MRCGGILSRIKNGGELFKISEKINVILIQASSALPDWSDQNSEILRTRHCPKIVASEGIP